MAIQGRAIQSWWRQSRPHETGGECLLSAVQRSPAEERVTSVVYQSRMLFFTVKTQTSPELPREPECFLYAASHKDIISLKNLHSEYILNFILAI